MRFIFSLFILASAAAPSLAQPAAAPRPRVLADVLNCRTVTDAAQRLACFDRAVTALQTAEAQREVVVIDRERVRKTRRSVFGLMLPDLDIFGDNSDDPEAVSELTSTLKGATQNGLGKWILTLADGARWVQLDSRDLPRDPRVGQNVRIRRAAMGSYLANIDGQIAIRVRRER